MAGGGGGKHGYKSWSRGRPGGRGLAYIKRLEKLCFRPGQGRGFASKVGEVPGQADSSLEIWTEAPSVVGLEHEEVHILLGLGGQEPLSGRLLTREAEGAVQLPQARARRGHAHGQE